MVPSTTAGPDGDRPSKTGGGPIPGRGLYGNEALDLGEVLIK